MKLRKIWLWLIVASVVERAFASEPIDRIVDTRGPIQNLSMAVKVDKEGVQAPGYSWPKPVDKDSWSAQWIVCASEGVPDSAAVCLRKEFVLGQEPKKVTAWITSGNYLLYLNGKPAARGPADAGRDFAGTSSGHRFYDYRDLTPFFHQGKNALAAELIGCNGLQLEIRVEYADGQIQVIQTDDTWKGIFSPYLKNSSLPLEKGNSHSKRSHLFFDAEAEPVGWQLAGFDDAKWSACQVSVAPTDALVVSELPPLMEARYPFFEIVDVRGEVVVPPAPLREGNPILVKGNGEFSVHFDRVMAGRCGIKVKGCKGTKIILTSNETDTPGGRGYELLLRDGLQYFESPDYYSLGTIHVSVQNAMSPIEIEEVSADCLSQPVEYLGSFTCSDDLLNALWKSGRWSTQICMMTHHLDSPQHQEPIGDYGDYLIADLVNYNAMGNNTALARQDLRKWAWVMENARYRTFHTSYLFFWLQSLLNYYDYTGDRSVIDELAPNVHAVIDQFSSYLGKNGLISEAPNYMFMDWATVYDDKNPSIQFPVHHPPAVIGQGYLSALYYRALADAIRVSELTRDPGHAEKYEKRRQEVASAYRRELWNAERGQFRDGKPFVSAVKPGKWLPADVAMESFSVQNNALSVLYDLAPRDEQPGIIETMVMNPHWDVTPYFMHFVFDAFAHVGLFDQYGVPRMHAYQVVPETQTVREMGAGKGDYSHGWVASPTYQMSSKILGVVPTSAGFATMAIRPTLCGLSFAKGAVPSPHGLIKVDWQRRPDQLQFRVTVPPDTRANVALPVGQAPNPEVSSAGKIVWKDARAVEKLPGSLGISHGNGTIEIGLSPGTYEFNVSGLLPQAP